jgi:hypothetical protein
MSSSAFERHLAVRNAKILREKEARESVERENREQEELKAKLEAAKLKKEQEELKAKLEQEARDKAAKEKAAQEAKLKKKQEEARVKAKLEQEARDKAAKEKADQDAKLKKEKEELKAKIEQEAKDKADSEKENQASNIEQDNLEIQDPLQEVVNQETIEQPHEVNFIPVKLEEASILLVNATNSTETINKSLRNNILIEGERHVDQNIFSIYKEKLLERNMLVDLDQEAKDLIAETRDRQAAEARELEEVRAFEELMNHEVPNNNYRSEESDALIEELSKELEELSKEFSRLLEEIGTTVNLDQELGEGEGSGESITDNEDESSFPLLGVELKKLNKLNNNQDTNTINTPNELINDFFNLEQEEYELSPIKLDNEILDLSLEDGQGFDLSDDEGYRDNAAHNQPLNVVSDLDRFLGARKIKDIPSTTANALNDQENGISNDYELLHHDVTLDITAVMGRQSVVDRFDQIANEPLGRFFIETYSPILAEFENLYKQSPQLKIACIDGEQAELNKIADDINKLLSQLGWNQQKIDQVDVTKANGDTPTHLGFLRNAILKNKSLAEIVDGYTDENYREIKGLAYRFSEQFYKDFKRMTIEVVDQNGEVIYENLSKEFTGEDPEAINVFLKGTLNLSDEQLKFLVVRLNQRSIDSAGVAFMSGIQKERNNIFHVENNDGKLQLMFVEHKAVMQRNIETEDGDIIGKEDLNEVSYLIDVRNLIANDDGREFLALPTQNTFEVIYYKAFINEAIVTLPDFITPLKVTINSISDLDEFLRTTADTNEEFDISSYVEVDPVDTKIFSDDKDLLFSLAHLAYKSDRSGMKADHFEELKIDGYEIVKLSIKSEDVMLFLKDNNIYISYPGTQNVQDLFTDLNAIFISSGNLGFKSGAIHAGFYNSFISTWNGVIESINKYCKDNNKNIFDINFSFTGHSKGGAVANIAYAALANLLYSENEGLFNPDKFHLMTFAAPRVFDYKMVSNCQNLGIATRVCRVVNDNDIVPKVLFGSLGYKHMGDYVMKKYSKEIFSIKAHVLGSYHGDEYVEHIHESNGNMIGKLVFDALAALSSVLPKTTANLAIKNQLFKPEEVTERSLVIYQPSNNNQPIAEIDQYRSIYEIVVSSFILDHIKPYIPNEYRLFIREEVTARSLFYIKSYIDKYQSLIKPAEVTKLLLDVGYKYRKINIPLIEPVSNNNVLNFLPAIDKLTNDATSSFVYSLISSVIWPFKKMYYHEEVSVFNRILSENRIDASIDIINNPSEFKRKVLLKLHPDKGGNDAEFKSIQNIKELLNSDINTGQIIIDTTKFAQKKIHETSIGVKIFDTTLDSIRLFNKPTFENGHSLVMDAVQLYNMYFGSNVVTISITGSDFVFKLYQGQYYKAISSLPFIALPSIIQYSLKNTDNKYIGPILSLGFGASFLAYSVYNTVNNAYSLYQEIFNNNDVNPLKIDYETKINYTSQIISKSYDDVSSDFCIEKNNNINSNFHNNRETVIYNIDIEVNGKINIFD